MNKLTRDDLYSLEDYSQQRNEFRKRVMQHKKIRKIALGEHAVLAFEDRLIMQYQVQEMLRIERIFEADAIQQELDAYNPLVPDGTNWKATLMIEYEDEEERKQALEKMVGIEDRIWVQIAGHEPVYAIADEDMDRSDDSKTSAVHFLRFELDPEMITAVKSDAPISAGIDHIAYSSQLNEVNNDTRKSLIDDLD